MIRYVGRFAIAAQTDDAGAGRRGWLAANITPDESVVDLGGCGGMLHPWHDNVTGFDDLSGFGPGHRIFAPRFQRGDVCALPFADGEFDVAVLAEVLEHVPTPVVALREAARVARRVLITTPWENLWQNPAAFHIAGHIRYWTPDTLAAALRAAGLHGDLGVLQFGTWAFFACVVSGDAAAPPWDKYAAHGPQEAAANA